MINQITPVGIEWYKQNRPEHYNYVKNEILNKDNTCKMKVVSAGVKVGKRSFVILCKLLDNKNTHIFISALNRKADETQRNEYKSYGIEVFSSPEELKSKCFKFINNTINKNKIIVHVDELDYGCGNNQNISKIVNNYITNKNVDFILYSATSEVAEIEFLSPNKIEHYKTLKKFIPSKMYYGIKNYLYDDLFHDSEDFFTYNYNTQNLNFTSQGEKLINDLIKNKEKHIGVVRLPGNMKDGHGNSRPRFDIFKENQDEIKKKYVIRLKFIGSKDEDCKWDDEAYWEEINPKFKYIFVINQVAGRSTEWKCLPYLAWYHCHRGSKTTPASTIIQDQERVDHYLTHYNRNNHIHIYGDRLAAQYSAGLITYASYDSKSERKLNSRLYKKKGVKIITKSPKIFDNWDDIPYNYRKNRCKDHHISEEYKFTKNDKMSEKYWNKYKRFEGFYMSNLRGSRIKVLKGHKNAKQPIFFRKDIMNDLKEGISETCKIRINVFYENDELNPDKFKFMVREFESTEPVNIVNSSVYDN